MSKIKFSLSECKITSIPIKFEKDDKSFSRVIFNICFTKSQKDKETSEWVNKNLYTQCIVFNEKLAEKILSSFKKDIKNYLTSNDCTLNDFNFNETLIKNEKTGKSYKTYNYFDFQIIINDGVITYKEDKKESNLSNKPTKGEEEFITEMQKDVIEQDEEIPF